LARLAGGLLSVASSIVRNLSRTIDRRSIAGTMSINVSKIIRLRGSVFQTKLL
jgi:hypothetical protein